jgi:cytochrome P450 family 49 subfamily A
MYSNFCPICVHSLNSQYVCLYISLELYLTKQTKVFSHFMVNCQLEKYFEDAGSFKPERWLQNRTNRNISPFSILPFGFGNRMCVGRRFSELELYLAVSKVILNFKLEPVTQHLDRTHAFIVVPSHDVSIRFTPRA